MAKTDRPRPMTSEDVALHKILHKTLDELVACYLHHARRLPSKTTVAELLAWSHEQATAVPTAPSPAEPARAASAQESVDDRFGVLERRVLAQGPTVRDWAVEVAQPIGGVWIATLYVGAQSFRIAEGSDPQAEAHCMFVGEMFVKALRSLIGVETGAER